MSAMLLIEPGAQYVHDCSYLSFIQPYISALYMRPAVRTDPPLRAPLDGTDLPLNLSCWAAIPCGEVGPISVHTSTRGSWRENKHVALLIGAKTSCWDILLCFSGLMFFNHRCSLLRLLNLAAHSSLLGESWSCFLFILKVIEENWAQALKTETIEALRKSLIIKEMKNKHTELTLHMSARVLNTYFKNRFVNHSKPRLNHM